MKKLIYIIIALSLTGCGTSDHKKSVLLNISATGEIEVIPDIASITVHVSCLNKNLSKSNNCTKKRITKLFTLLEQHKILKKDYHSSRVNLAKEYIWQKNSQVFTGYKSSSTINILFRDLDNMSKVLTKTMLMKNIDVSNLSYSHSNIDSLANDAYLEAIKNSRTLVNKIKDNLNGQTVEVLEISNTSNGFSGIESKRYESANYRSKAVGLADISTIQINPGSLKLIKNVYVLYKMKFQTV